MRDMHQAIDKSRITFINRERISLIFPLNFQIELEYCNNSTVALCIRITNVDYISFHPRASTLENKVGILEI